MDDQFEPKNKSELLERMERARTGFEQAIGQLSEAQLTTPHPDSGWTIKDHLAHLAAWEAGIAALLQRQPRWEAMGVDEATAENHEMDDLNDIIYRQHQDRPLAEVRTYFDEAHRQMLAALSLLSDEELFKPYAYYEGEKASDDNDTQPVINWISGNTYEHYEEHQGWIEALL
jgi:hypothetical protein